MMILGLLSLKGLQASIWYTMPQIQSVQPNTQAIIKVSDLQNDKQPIWLNWPCFVNMMVQLL